MLVRLLICVNCLIMAYDVKLKYTDVFVADPKFVLDGERPEGAKENTALLESNKAWINDRSGKEVTKRMINVKNTMPITPHGVYKYVDDSPYCWVMFAYDSDEDVQSEILDIAENLSEYFYERCAVGMLDMAYPSNKFSFGYLIEDMPMLLVKKSGRSNKMLQDYIEQDTFVLRDRTQWGGRVMTDDLEDDINKELEKILKNYYNGMSEFVKLTSIHLAWYGTHNADKAAAQNIIKEHVTALAKEYEAQELKLNKQDFFEKIQETAQELKEKLEDQGKQTSPRLIQNIFGGNFESEKTKYGNEEL